MKRPRLRSSAQKLLAGVVEIGYRMKNIHIVGLQNSSWVDSHSSEIKSAPITSKT